MLGTIVRTLCAARRVKTANLLILDDSLVRAIVIIAIESSVGIGEWPISTVSAFTTAPKRSRCRENLIFVKRIEIHLLGQRTEGYSLLGKKFKLVIYASVVVLGNRTVRGLVQLASISGGVVIVVEIGSVEPATVALFLDLDGDLVASLVIGQILVLTVNFSTTIAGAIILEGGCGRVTLIRSTAHLVPLRVTICICSITRTGTVGIVTNLPKSWRITCSILRECERIFDNINDKKKETVGNTTIS